MSTIEWNSNQDKIYLNWGSAERIRKDVVIAEKKFLGWQLAFEDQPEKAIRVLREAISVSRKKIGALIKATPSRSIIFTTGTEESLKTVLFRHDIIPYGSEIVITDCEFYGIHSKISPPRYHPRIAAIWNLDDPAAIVDAISREVNSNTRLLLISHVTYNSGALLPIAEITEECKRKNPELFVLIDGAQAIGHIPVDVQRLKCDFYGTLSHSGSEPLHPIRQLFYSLFIIFILNLFGKSGFIGCNTFKNKFHRVDNSGLPRTSAANNTV